MTSRQFDRLARRVEEVRFRVQTRYHQTNNPGLLSLIRNLDSLHNDLCVIIGELPRDSGYNRGQRAMLDYNRRELADIETEFQTFL